jgi:thiamine biosynthesis lipoprotein
MSGRVLVPDLAVPPLPRPGGAVIGLRGATMGTSWSVRLVVRPGAALAGLQQGIQSVLDGVVAQMSGWEPGSDLCRFNRARPGWQALPADLLEVLRAGLAVARDTGGAFDPTMGALSALWGFGPEPVPEGLPPRPAIEAARARLGWERLLLDPAADRAWQPGGLALDLCGIAKGFAVDRVADWLRRAGYADFLVEVGGELLGRGLRPDGMPWWVELERPPGPDGAAPFRVALHGLSVATSGDYRRGFTWDGRHYGHTLDPRSGWPIPAALAAVTVLHARCMQADALATALSVLGPEAGLAHATSHGIAALFLLREAGGLREVVSPAFAAMLD